MKKKPMSYAAKEIHGYVIWPYIMGFLIASIAYMVESFLIRISIIIVMSVITCLAAKIGSKKIAKRIEEHIEKQCGIE